MGKPPLNRRVRHNCPALLLAFALLPIPSKAPRHAMLASAASSLSVCSGRPTEMRMKLFSSLVLRGCEREGEA